MQDANRRPTQEERSAAMRARLVAAGRRLFVENGFAATGTPEIARAAGVTRGALYHHFADKSDLFFAVLRAEAEAVADEIATAAGSGLPGLRAGAAAYFHAMSEPGRARLMLIDAPAVLGPAAVAGVDAATGGATLRAGLTELGLPASDAEVSALADVLSAGFDRAAQAIADGADAAPYLAAIGLLLDGLAN